ncbi:methylated-DNA--[protein]-cysteine S-methyltransferase [Chitinophaga qingshengii]|uniref:Methylated-DNA--[protein]-cysteine S-methyltransferase n=1 Tax=Chitinophaga qingshengii TaxID=1569794 RepID=A0ABR7TMS8_9BACT|nr:methylated-DNA--[protein]-cysteine S-methyltransferase [Chitinophaga qingshengii]MBC9931791.1 methylated-DNA--[protein]-cysteine S-methyltransferase [Chitinophaga qingshengii]
MKKIYQTQLETPLGPMMAGATDEGICLLEFMERKIMDAQWASLRKQLKATIIAENHPHFTRLQQELDAYFTGTLHTFTVPLHMPGTAFQQAVWELLLTVPYGDVRTYKQQAVLLQRPAAVRAVGHANGMNRISIIVPCHRIVGGNRDLTGYGGGIWRKQWLLEHENKFQRVG